MLVTLGNSALKTGDVVVVNSHGGVWSATWRGDCSADAGESVDVEISIEEPISVWEVMRAGGAISGISTVGGCLIVCGEIITVSDDGVVAVDLHPGLVLIEVEGSGPPLRVGELIGFSPRTIEIVPTGI